MCQPVPHEPWLPKGVGRNCKASDYGKCIEPQKAHISYKTAHDPEYTTIARDYGGFNSYMDMPDAQPPQSFKQKDLTNLAEYI